MMMLFIFILFQQWEQFTWIQRSQWRFSTITTRPAQPWKRYLEGEKTTNWSTSWPSPIMISRWWGFRAPWWRWWSFHDHDYDHDGLLKHLGEDDGMSLTKNVTMMVFFEILGEHDGLLKHLGEVVGSHSLPSFVTLTPCHSQRYDRVRLRFICCILICHWVFSLCSYSVLRMKYQE